jgi:integrase
MTIAALMEEWLDHGRTKSGKPWTRRTANDNRTQVEQYVVPTLGHIPVAELCARDLERAYSTWGRSVSDSSVSRYARLVSSALSLAVRRGYRDDNPASVAVAPAQGKSKTKVPTDAEVAKLRTAAEAYGKSMPAVIALSVLTCARAGSIAALCWADVDLKAGSVRIATSASAVGGVVEIGDTKNETSRTVPIKGANLTYLKQALGTPGDPDTYVIDGGDEPINPAVLTDRFTAVRGLAHVRGVTLTGLRHYFVSRLCDAGVSPYDVAALGGWKSVRMVLEIYGHHTTAGIDRAAEVAMIA